MSNSLVNLKNNKKVIFKYSNINKIETRKTV